MKNVFVTGGAGYVGSVLVSRLIKRGYKVKVLDLYLYGEDVLKESRGSDLIEIKGDLRDHDLLRREVMGCDCVIHLACISNDPSFELDPRLSKSINYDAFRPLVEISKENGVARFMFASSSSVYGVKQEENVDETMSLEPLTDYSRYKALCEQILLEYQAPDFTTVILRPATVCGYSPRQRLDVIVNILTNHAYHLGKIKVLGGEQKRPNIHIGDMVRAYELLLSAPDRAIAGKVFNVGYENHSVLQLAQMVQRVVGSDRVQLVLEATNDPRSYHISSTRITRELGFEPCHSIEEAIRDLVRAFEKGLLRDSLLNSRYYNIKRMQEVQLT